MKRPTPLAVLAALGLACAAGLGGLPKDVLGFARWTKVASRGLPADGPHAGTNKVVYANPAAAKAWAGEGALPVGSLVVKTTGPAGAPALVAVMRKERTGWFYEEYLPGSGGYRLAFGGPGKQALCVNCHAGAKTQDFLFTRP